MNSELLTEVGGAELVDELEPLWLTLLAHHAEVRPDLAVQDPGLSWQTRRSWYLTWLFDPDSFVVIARYEHQPVGYALVEVADGPDDTWRTGRRVATLQSLSVAPQWRGRGIGGGLVDRVDAELAGRGIGDVFLDVVLGNDGARRFYERRGFAPTTMRLARLGRRTHPRRWGS
ncbi:MAG TPA: GNAT family N-acetyltransferase [Micromonosporaceae bacterium]|nr:GNAT family N-acetyltransferase [Micromonosporaceae bacterium]